MLKLNGLNFSYTEKSNENELKEINLHIKKGEIILLCGESGSGKTTITRSINGLIPNFYEGNLSGNITLIDEDLHEMPIYKISEKVGSVFQNPKTQFFNVDTTSELAFGCENLGLPATEIENRINKVVSEFEIENLLDKSIFKLSGGEKQKIACASVSACYPDILLLDEPSSNLDSKSTWDLRKMILFWKNKGKTVIIAEHRLYFLKDIIDRIVYLKDGKINMEISSEELKSMNNDSFLKLGIRPLYLDDLTKNEDLISTKKSIYVSKNSSKPYLHLKNFKFSYDKKLAIDIDSLKIPQNETIAIIGNNGVGKSTFARCLCGLERKCKGTMNMGEKTLNSKDRLKISYMVMQDVNHQLFTESVIDELLLSMNKIDEIDGVQKTPQDELIEAETILKNLDLLHLKDYHPMALSGGQKQRVAIGSALASKKEIIIFDEPTSGLDLKHMKEVALNIKNLQINGITPFIVSHDLELILECCTYVIHLNNGKIIDNYFIDDEGEKKLKDFFILY